MKTQIKYPQVPYSRDAGGYCPVTGEPGGFYLGNSLKTDLRARYLKGGALFIRKRTCSSKRYGVTESYQVIETLAAPDVSLIARDAKINVPFAGTEVSYQAFLIIGPLTMVGLVI